MRRTYLRTRLRVASQNTRAHTWERLYETAPGAIRRLMPDHPFGREEVDWLARDRRAMAAYRPVRYPGKITFYWAAHDQRPPEVRDTREGWSEIAGGGLEVRAIVGNHLTFVLEPLVRGLAEAIKADLDALDGSNAELPFRLP
jgi:hypothetical protein